MKKHFIVSGRIPFDGEDSIYHFELEEGESPVKAFVEQIYSDGDPDALPADWEGDEFGNNGEVWAIVNAVIEIPGPPLSWRVLV